MAAFTLHLCQHIYLRDINSSLAPGVTVLEIILPYASRAPIREDVEGYLGGGGGESEEELREIE